MQLGLHWWQHPAYISAVATLALGIIGSVIAVTVGFVAKERLSAQVSRLEDEQKTLTMQNAALATDNTALHEDREALSKTNSTLRAESGTLRVTSNELRAQNDTLKATNGDFRTDNDQLRVRNSDLQGEKNALEEKITELTGVRGELQSRVTELETKALALQASNSELNESLRRTTTELAKFTGPLIARVGCDDGTGYIEGAGFGPSNGVVILHATRTVLIDNAHLPSRETRSHHEDTLHNGPVAIGSWRDNRITFDCPATVMPKDETWIDNSSELFEAALEHTLWIRATIVVRTQEGRESLEVRMEDND